MKTGSKEVSGVKKIYCYVLFISILDIFSYSLVNYLKVLITIMVYKYRL